MCYNVSEIIKSDRYDELSQLLSSLCNKYKLKEIKIDVEVQNETEKMLSKGYFSVEKNAIIMNPVFFYSFNEKTIYHEFRHYWQFEKYKEVYLWWLEENKSFYEELLKKKDVNGKQLAYIICELELDADEFGNSYGVMDKEELLKNFSPNIDEYKKRVFELLKRK